MTVLLQVSDPHFGTERPHVLAALRALAAEVRPDLLLLSGDITQRATRAQFTAARQFVDTVGIAQVVAIPGNHDIPLFNLPARMLWPYFRYRRAFGSALESIFENNELLLLALNTTRWYRHIDGELSNEQIERVAIRLEQAPPSCWRIVVTHQPLAVPRLQDVHDLVHGHEKALRRWAAAGADVVMGGHIHLPYVLPLHRQMPALRRPLWVVQAGTALSHRVRVGAPNSVNLLRIDAGGDFPRRLQVERWDYSEDAHCFVQVAISQLSDEDKN